MFDKNIKIYGKYSEIIKKFSKDKQSADEVKYTIGDGEGKSRDIYIFDTMIQCYMIAAMLGIINKKTLPEDTDKSKSINIFAEAVIKNRTNLEKIYQNIILSEENDTTIDAKIKEAFNLIDNTDEDSVMLKLNSYVYGGLSIINDRFSSCSTYEDICNSFYDLFEELNCDSIFQEIQ